MHIYEHSNRDVYMSCGHHQNMDMMTTGRDLAVDLNYYATQGLCQECWVNLRKLRAEQKAEKAEAATFA